jgi:hypothetical protein
VVPPLFGALFSLAMVWLVKGEISAIAIGVGTVVLGIALSYSIHIVSHLNSKSSPKEIIEELAEPLTIGCFTTIGAFAALIFTPSVLLQDMGLFSVFTLIGTTIFSLVFMPQFLRGFEATKKSPLLEKIEQWVGYRYDGNKWVILSILALFVLTCFNTVNLTLLFFGLFVLFGAISRDKENAYVRLSLGGAYKKLKSGVAVKRVAVSVDTPIKTLLLIADPYAINEILVYDYNKKIATITDDELSKLLYSAKLYAPVGEYLQKSQ